MENNPAIILTFNKPVYSEWFTVGLLNVETQIQCFSLNTLSMATHDNDAVILSCAMIIWKATKKAKCAKMNRSAETAKASMVPESIVWNPPSQIKSYPYENWL